MQLKLKNAAKIKEATININGITVIAGENNTGKSTIGKLLFSIYNSMNNMREKIEQEKKNEIYRIVMGLLQNRILRNNIRGIDYRRKCSSFARRFSQNIVEFLSSSTEEEIEHFIEKQMKDESLFGEIEDVAEFIDECTNRLEVIINISDEKVMKEVITRWFDRVFENQISPLIAESGETEINLDIKNKKVDFVFLDDRCVEWNSEIDILHEAFYIDNPFIIDKMADGKYGAKMTEVHLLDYLCKDEEDILDGIFDAVVARDKLDEIYHILGEVIEGDIIGNSDGEYYLKSNKFSKPINVKNLSTGLKSFALIKRLLETGSLKEKDVLILDEPEIHLHPEWQLLYAKIIVLLQKKFDLTVLITTHSPYFLDAIDVFAAKYEMSDKVNFYLAENEGAVSCLRDVTNNIDVIYKKLSDPMQQLENIRNGADMKGV